MRPAVWHEGDRVYQERAGARRKFFIASAFLLGYGSVYTGVHGRGDRAERQDNGGEVIGKAPYMFTQILSHS
jgi:hypothetical protein